MQIPVSVFICVHPRFFFTERREQGRQSMIRLLDESRLNHLSLICDLTFLESLLTSSDSRGGTFWCLLSLADVKAVERQYLYTQ